MYYLKSNGINNTHTVDNANILNNQLKRYSQSSYLSSYVILLRGSSPENTASQIYQT